MSHHRRRPGLRRALVAAALPAALVACAPPAAAHGRAGHRGHGHGRGWAGHAVRHHGHIRPPAVIHHHHAPAFRSHFAGSFHFAPHRHAHAIYAFPVATSYGVVYRPHVYCGGHLVAGAHLPPSRGWISVGVAAPLIIGAHVSF
jgi:hypothetical protein